jgi:penicillin-binding protein 1B
MAVTNPPSGRKPPVTSRRPSRVVKYEENPPNLFKRWMKKIFRPPVIVALVFLTTIFIGLLGYYYKVFAGIIDKRLRGEVFTRSAGIYARPKDLRVNGNVSTDDLVAFLKRVGYVDKSQQADTSRGRYNLNGATLEIEPSQNSSIDGNRTFPRLKVQFARGGKSIASINNLDTGTKLETAQLEPESISSVTGSEREKRKIIGFKDLPPHLIKAITATEDRSFFEHYGINLRGIARAFLRRYDTDSNSAIANQGGSSITQQLVKNLLLSPERTWRRKFSEAYMSIILETRLSKEEIFALYCNEIYLGQQAGFSINGVGEAAEAYFNKDVTTLTLSESALLAGMIRSPNRYNPYRHNETAKARRNQVLQSMVEAGVISKEESTKAQADEMKLAPTKGRVDLSDAPYFVDYTQSQLADMVADMNAAQHLRVYTTIDMDLQRAAYNAVTKHLASLDKILARRKIPSGTVQAALVAMNAKTGEIIAMVGGRDYEKSQLNRATEAMRQPGSVYKPFVYATALNTAYDPVPRVITAASVYTDEPKTFTFDNKEYSPGNFGDIYSNGPVTLRDALVKSLNVVTVELAMEVTIGRVVNLAAKAGLPKPQKPYPAVALGASEATPLQIASAYTAFASGGTRVTPVVINRITSGKGETLLAPTTQKNEVLKPEVAYIMTSFMKDVVNRGTAAKLRARGFRATVAGKTGTSRDGWFTGYTPNIVCAVWVGFDDGSQLGLTGGEAALPIWGEFMTAALAAHPEWGGDWQVPSNIEQVDIDPRTGLLAIPDDPNKRTELFISGTAPTEQSTEPVEETPAEGETPTDGSTEASPAGDGSVPEGTTPTEGRGVSGVDGVPQTGGSITLDIDPTTNLIAVPTCPAIKSKTFVIGQEPKKYCGPEHHADASKPPG